jgi:putative RecB family exonuclease
MMCNYYCGGPDESVTKGEPVLNTTFRNCEKITTGQYICMAYVTGEDTDKLPRALSPSRAAEFTKCPAKYYLKAIKRIREPSTEAQLKGSIAHAAYENLFNYPRSERTADLAGRLAWEELERLRDDPNYIHLIGDDDGARNIGEMSEKLARNGTLVERMQNFDPVGREVVVSTVLENVPLYGIVDRLDRVEYKDGSAAWMVSDYKTGKVPSASSRYLDETFFQLRTYAAMLREITGGSMEPSKLRLIFTKNGRREDVRARDCDNSVMDRTVSKIRKIYDGIEGSLERSSWQCNVHILCDWCAFKPVCPAHNPEYRGADGDTIAEGYGQTMQETPVSVGISGRSIVGLDGVQTVKSEEQKTENFESDVQPDSDAAANYSGTTSSWK